MMILQNSYSARYTGWMIESSSNQDQYYHFHIGDQSHLIKMTGKFCQTDKSTNHLRETHLLLT